VHKVFGKSFFAASVCTRVVQIFQVFLADWITAFLKKQCYHEDVLGKGPFRQHLNSNPVFTGALGLSRP
jgi:hypothetical protein